MLCLPVLIMRDSEILLIGAGLAGLACARVLHEEGLQVHLLEAQDRVGGRVQTDEVNGFLLNRGFQVFLTAYPEAQACLDYDRLDLQPFYEGALVRFDGRLHRLADPFRHPLDTPGTILSPIGTFRDKLHAARARSSLSTEPLETLLGREEITMMQALRERWGFSEQMVDRFFRPLFGSILLSEELDVSSRMFEFLFRMLSTGRITLPTTGMQAIPEQLARSLPEEAIYTGTRVEELDGTTVTLSDGSTLSSRAVVVATEEPAAARLLGWPRPKGSSRATTCLYFAAEEAPVEEPILLLNGDNEGSVNLVTVPSNVSPTYAPSGAALICVSLIGRAEEPEQALRASVRRQLFDWFGEPVSTWQHLRTYQIPYALPAQRLTEHHHREVRLGEGRYACGDYLDMASINGALTAGRRAAEAVLEDLSG